MWIKIRLFIVHVTIEARPITKVTATPIPIAELVFLLTQKKGHNPKNLVSMKLFTKIAPIIK